MGTEDFKSKSKYVPVSSLTQPPPQTGPLDPGNSFPTPGSQGGADVLGTLTALWPSFASASRPALSLGWRTADSSTQIISAVSTHCGAIAILGCVERALPWRTLVWHLQYRHKDVQKAQDRHSDVILLSYTFHTQHCPSRPGGPCGQQELTCCRKSRSTLMKCTMWQRLTVYFIGYFLLAKENT